MARPLITAVFKTLMRQIAEGNGEGLTIEDGRQTLAFRPDSG
ncbi:hypothetical protein [Aquisediminimonas profunda]|nr:hypothetical protein [Aquisediminimonas profunda]